MLSSCLFAFICSPGRKITRFCIVVPSWRVYITVVGQSIHRINSGPLVDAIPSSPQSLFLLVEFNTSFLVQLFSYAALLLCRIAWRWSLCKKWRIPTCCSDQSVRQLHMNLICLWIFRFRAFQELMRTCLLSWKSSQLLVSALQIRWAFWSLMFSLCLFRVVYTRRII